MVCQLYLLCIQGILTEDEPELILFFDKAQLLYRRENGVVLTVK